MHKTYVFRIDRNDGSPWIARPHDAFLARRATAAPFTGSGRVPGAVLQERCGISGTDHDRDQFGTVFGRFWPRS